MGPRWRLNLCAVLTLAPLAPIGARLAQLQVLEHRKLATIAAGEVVREAVEIVPRGRILDRSGRVLAASVPAWSAFLDPGSVKTPAATAEAIAEALGLDRREVLRKARSKSRFAWLKRKLTLEEAERLKALKLAGIGLVPDELRTYPNGDLARGLLGSVGLDGKGLAGLELAFEREISGKAQRFALVRDGAGNTMAASPRQAVEPPPDLRLTIDRNIQFYAEAAIAEAASAQSAASAVALVEDPRTGDLLAAASWPPDPLKDPPVQYVYEPGSTFKIVAMTGALEEGLAQPEEVLSCAGPWELAPSVFVRDHEPLGDLTVAGVLEKSSNVGMAKLGLRLGPDRLYRWARAYGFGTKTGSALPGESAGLLKPPASMSRVVLGNIAFGQGLGATPLQVLASFSAVAAGGVLLEPRIALGLGPEPAPDRALRRGTRTRGGPTIAASEGRWGAASRVRRVASPAVIGRVARMLEGVVERGTGTTAAVAGYSVAGKTGTAQKLDPATHRYSAKDYVASFAGYAPASDPRYAILIVIDSPRKQYYGAEVAAPVFSKLMRQILALGGVQPDRPLPVKAAAAPAPAPRAAAAVKHPPLPRPSLAP